jgi:hypothetical protein
VTGLFSKARSAVRQCDTPDLASQILTGLAEILERRVSNAPERAVVATLRWLASVSVETGDHRFLGGDVYLCSAREALWASLGDLSDALADSSHSARAWRLIRGIRERYLMSDDARRLEWA